MFDQESNTETNSRSASMPLVTSGFNVMSSSPVGERVSRELLLVEKLKVFIDCLSPGLTNRRYKFYSVGDKKRKERFLIRHDGNHARFFVQIMVWVRQYFLKKEALILIII